MVIHFIYLGSDLNVVKNLFTSVTSVSLERRFKLETTGSAVELLLAELSRVLVEDSRGFVSFLPGWDSSKEGFVDLLPLFLNFSRYMYIYFLYI